MDDANNKPLTEETDEDLYGKYKQLEELKEELIIQIKDIEENGDKDTKEKIKKLQNKLDDEKIQDYGMNKEDIDKSIESLKKIHSGVSFYKQFMNAFETEMDIDPGRLLGLTDGIFGMVMTLLVFGMALPASAIANSAGFSQFIISIIPTIGTTIISFILVSAFWIYHHEFIKIKSLNLIYLWINIFFLASISFIPFSTSIIGEYSEFFLAEVIFGLNIFLTLSLFIIMFYYANKRKFLEREVSDEERRYIYHTFIIIMVITMIVNLLDYNISPNFIYLFLLIPIISALRDIWFQIKHPNK